VGAITTIPTALLCDVRHIITHTITYKFWNRYKTTGIIEIAVEAKVVAIIAREQSTPSQPHSIVLYMCCTCNQPTISNRFWFWKRYRTTGKIKIAFEAKRASTFPSALHRVVSAITITITNPFQRRYGTIGKIEATVEAKIAITVVDAIITIPFTLFHVVKLVMITCTSGGWNSHHHSGRNHHLPIRNLPVTATILCLQGFLEETVWCSPAVQITMLLSLLLSRLYYVCTDCFFLSIMHT
jgi:hypothetical protein